MSGFVIRGLDPAPYAPLFALDDEALVARDARRVVATEAASLPCRTSLADAEPGETLILVNFEHLPVASPFRSRHAIFIRENAGEAAEYRDTLPEQFRSRTLSLRSLDDAGMIVEAELVEGREAQGVIERMLAAPGVAYIHAHFARYGCYAGRIDRG